MALTPQLIKDQEFQPKFRGIDPLEVRDYLETIADEFFELQEQYKEQFEELRLLRKEKTASADYSSSLETDMEFTRKISDELKDGCTQKEEKIKELTREIDELQLRIADMDQEGTEHEEEISAASAKIDEAEAALKDAEARKGILANKIEILLEQNNELKKEEVDFKSTLSIAQQFAEDLKAKSKIQAEKIIAEANAEIKKIRDDAREELERLPLEIHALKRKKSEVKTDLKATLKSYLETIEVFYPDEEEELDDVPESAGDEESEEIEKMEGSDELFQTIEINEDGTLSPEDVEKLNDDPEGSGDLNEEALDSLLRGEGKVGDGDDAFNLKDMFSLETEEEKKK